MLFLDFRQMGWCLSDRSFQFLIRWDLQFYEYNAHIKLKVSKIVFFFSWLEYHRRSKTVINTIEQSLVLQMFSGVFFFKLTWFLKMLNNCYLCNPRSTRQ